MASLAEETKSYRIESSGPFEIPQNQFQSMIQGEQWQETALITNNYFPVRENMGNAMMRRVVRYTFPTNNEANQCDTE